MEPALDERGDSAMFANSAASGGAAMEPALDERGDVGEHRGRLRMVGAAMEPALDERGDLSRIYSALSLETAAMEPALDERGDHGCPHCPKVKIVMWVVVHFGHCGCDHVTAGPTRLRWSWMW